MTRVKRVKSKIKKHKKKVVLKKVVKKKIVRQNPNKQHKKPLKHNKKQSKKKYLSNLKNKKKKVFFKKKRILFKKKRKPYINFVSLVEDDECTPDYLDPSNSVVTIFDGDDKNDFVIDEIDKDCDESESNEEDNKDLYDENDQLVGTPQEVKKELNSLALRVQRYPRDNDSFDKIHYYIHKYLLGLVFKKYCFIKGYDENDMYQESLIALFKKAIPNFNPNKGMSFLNFAKMCINRHLITILHASKHRKKNIPINTAISMDRAPVNQTDNADIPPLSNVIADDSKKTLPYKNISNMETFSRILLEIKDKLSKFESVVLDEYLYEKSYREVAKSVSLRLNRRYDAKSIDNALLRIRKKSQKLIKNRSKTVFNNFY